MKGHCQETFLSLPRGSEVSVFLRAIDVTKMLLFNLNLHNNCHIVALASSGNPLHVASAYGHTDFAREVLRLRPDFAKELNGDGFSPMHMASANGHLDFLLCYFIIDLFSCLILHLGSYIVYILLFHLAVIRGRVDVIGEVKCQFEAIKVMVDWNREMKKEDMLNVKDEHGNTALPLHLATWKKQRRASSFSCFDLSIFCNEFSLFTREHFFTLDLLFFFKGIGII
ncbi:hypothetical protein ACOSQ2_000258 [Xanthoceras sorbifolium]